MIFGVLILTFLRLFRNFRAPLSLSLLFIIISSNPRVQSKEIKIFQIEDKDSRAYSPAEKLSNTLSSTAIPNDQRSRSNKIVLNVKHDKKDQFPIFRGDKDSSNETSTAQNSNGKTAPRTLFQSFQLKSISSSENGERNGRVSVTRAALRIAARHALEATLNLYDKKEPNMLQRGK